MSIVNNLSSVKDLIDKTRANSALAGASVSLVVVSKTQTEDKIKQVLGTGHRIFGENRLQEALEKWVPLKETFPDIELHLIGPLQTNKAKKAVAFFDVIETIDRPKIAFAIARAMAENGRTPRLFIQVNTGEEEQKAGISPAAFPDLLDYCQSELNLEIEGLMCLPPANEASSPHFALLNKLANRHSLKNLSMGMSCDYQAAIELGATQVRIGAGIFGPRT